MVCANVCRYATRAAMLMPDGIVVAGHGSRDPDGVREFEALVALIRMRASKRIVRHGYLEFALPTIDVAVRDALHAGAHPIVIVPGVLFAAAHAKMTCRPSYIGCNTRFPKQSSRSPARSICILDCSNCARNASSKRKARRWQRTVQVSRAIKRVWSLSDAARPIRTPIPR